jgi:UDP-glucose 4-epimerase
MVTIAITGLASNLARTVVPRLLSESSVEKIVGVDLRNPDYFHSEKIEFHRADVRDLEGLKKAFGRIDILLHLAFIVSNNVPNRPAIDAINIEGSKNAFQAALAGGARKIIHLSSVAAYGLLPGVPPLITEETPRRGEQNTNFYYPYTKALVEEYLDTFEKEHPQICITRFRPHIILGPNFAAATTNLGVFINPLLKGKSAWTFKPLNADSMLLQLTHEEDLAEAIVMAIKQDLPGAFNIAAQPINHADFLRRRGLKVRILSWGVADFGIAVGGLFSQRVRLLKGWTLGIKYQIVVSSEKLQSKGFTFKYPTTESIVLDVLKRNYGKQ